MTANNTKKSNIYLYLYLHYNATKAMMKIQIYLIW